MKRSRLFLYTTLGCHLCEMAEEVLFPFLGRYPVVLEKIEIAESEELVSRYGVRIPVVRLEGVTEELGWPFDGRQCDEYLATFTPLVDYKD